MAIPSSLQKTDQQLTVDVLGELTREPGVDDTDVGVQVKDGVVTLSGSVIAYPQKLAACEAAHRVLGVREVVNDLRVKLPETWERSDEELADAVRASLEWDVLVPDGIGFRVSEGVVTLAGRVGTWTERSDIDRAVHRLVGVRDVVNQISVGNHAVNPEKIEQKIKEALQRQAENGARRIRISVQDGVVRLTGVFRSWVEKNIIAAALDLTPEIRRIEDRTTVEPYRNMTDSNGREY